MINSQSLETSMIQYTRTYTRPNTSVPWWFKVTLSVSPTVFRTRMNDQYYSTGKCLSENFSISVDGLTLTYTGLWASEADFNEYNADPILSTYWAAKDEYNTLNNIVKGPLVIQSI